MRGEDAAKLMRLAADEGKELIEAADEATERFLVALRTAQERLNDRLTTFLNEAPDLSTMSVKARLNWYTENGNAIARMLRASGYNKAAKKYIDELDEIARKAGITTRAASGSAFAEVPDKFIQFLQGRTYEHLSFLGDEAVAKIDETLMEMVIGGYSRGTMLSELKSVITGRYPWGDKFGLYEWHAGTYVRTSAQRSAQLFMNYQAEKAGLDNFLYVGPVDEKVRPFCRELVGNIYSRAEIDKMDNGQTRDVFTTCGGFNCRHKWVAVSNEVARAAA